MKTKKRPEFSAPVTRKIPGYIRPGSSLFLQSFKAIIRLIPLFNSAYYVLLFNLNIINKNNNNRAWGLAEKTPEKAQPEKGGHREEFGQIFNFGLALKITALLLRPSSVEQMRRFV